jgi:hypothetical protein
MLVLKIMQQVAGAVLYNGKSVRMQVKVSRRQFALEFYVAFPLAFVLGKLKSRWPTLSERFKGCNGKKKYK